MAAEDYLIVIWVVDYTVVPGLICFVVYLLAKYLTLAIQFWHSVVLRILSRRENKYIESVKATIFADLHDIISEDWKLRNVGVIRILELNPGIGTNFKYFPKNCHLIVLEQNPFLRSHFEKNVLKYPEVKLEAYLNGGPENLCGVPDGYVDGVVSVGALSSVSDVQKMLIEVQRILVPKGQLFYVEPTSYQLGTWKHMLQRILNPVWFVMVGCHISRDLACSIKHSHLFSTVLQYQELVAWKRKINIVFHPTLIGIATK